MSKPSWDDAPSWAKYLAMDADGDWIWFANKPTLKHNVWLRNGGMVRVDIGSMFTISKAGTPTLEQKPEGVFKQMGMNDPELPELK